MYRQASLFEALQTSGQEMASDVTLCLCFFCALDQQCHEMLGSKPRLNVRIPAIAQHRRNSILPETTVWSYNQQGFRAMQGIYS